MNTIFQGRYLQHVLIHVVLLSVSLLAPLSLVHGAEPIVRPESGKWDMRFTKGWFGGGRTQIQNDRDRSQGELRQALAALERVAARHDAVLSNFEISLDGKHHPTVLMMGYSPREGISLENIRELLPKFGPALERQYLVGTGQCRHVSTQTRKVAGFVSVRGTFQCQMDSSVSAIMLFEQIRLPDGGEMSSIFQADERVRVPRISELNQMLDSIRLSR